MPGESHALMEGDAQALALVAATRAAVDGGEPLPWEQIDEIVRGDYTREALLSVALLVAFCMRLVDEGVQVPTPDFLDLLAGACAAELANEET